VPHHLLDVVTPAQPFSVADYVGLAEAAIGEVLARGRLPLVTGGTGFYLRALRQGLSQLPPADQEVQAPLWRIVERGGLAELVNELAAASPADAERVAGNPRRVVRSLEVLRRTGRAPSAFAPLPAGYSYDLVVLDPVRERLRARITVRTRRMFELGLVDEVARLLADYPQQPTALQAIGYKEVVAHLKGQVSLAQAIADVELATQRYAKRQRTWFRRDVGVRFVHAVGEEAEEELTAWLTALLP
jgi:tRNA dimethylallyltransferase